MRIANFEMRIADSESQDSRANRCGLRIRFNAKTPGRKVATDYRREFPWASHGRSDLDGCSSPGVMIDVLARLTLNYKLRLVDCVIQMSDSLGDSQEAMVTFGIRE